MCLINKHLTILCSDWSFFRTLLIKTPLCPPAGVRTGINTDYSDRNTLGAHLLAEQLLPVTTLPDV